MMWVLGFLDEVVLCTLHNNAGILGCSQLAGFVFLDLDDVGTVGEPHGLVFFDGALANSTRSLHAFEFDTQHHAAHGQQCSGKVVFNNDNNI